MPAFTAIGAYVAGTVLGLVGATATIVGAIVATGAAYVTSRIINGNANKGANAAAGSQGGRIQVAPATNNKIPVLYGTSFANGMITDARLISLENKVNDVMYYCLVLGETNNNINSTYGLESVYWNDLRLTALAATGANSHIVKDGRKVVNPENDPPTVAGSFVVGSTYVITKLGTTTQAQWNTIAGTAGRSYGPGSVFEAATTGASSGNGQAQVEDFIDTNFIVDTNQYVMLRVYAGGSTAADQIYPPQSAGNNAAAYNFWGSSPANPNGDGSWTIANEMKGLVFAIVKLRYSGDKGFTSLPNVTFQIANNVTNPADVWYDYMTSERYGAGIDPAYIDTAAQTEWYNFCEEDVSYTSVNLDPAGGAGTTNQATTRYSINGIVDTNNQVKANIDTILQNGGAWMSYNVDTGLWSPIIKKAVSAGDPFSSPPKYFTASRDSGNTLTIPFPTTPLPNPFPAGRIEVGQLLYNSSGTLIGTITAQLAPTAGETAGQIGRYTTSTSGTIATTTFYTLPASSLEFSDDNIISGITLSSTRLEDLYNSVEVEFYNKYNKDQKAYFRNYIAAGERNPNEPDNQLRMSLDLCNNSMQADILGQMELRQSRDDLVIEFTANHYGIQAQAGDIIAVTTELYDWAPKYFRVMRVKEIEGESGDLTAQIQALEYNPDAYTIEAISEFSTSSNVGIGVWGSSPNLPPPPDVIIATVDADSPIPNFQLQVTIPSTGGPFDEIELYYTEGWDQHLITGSIVPGTGSNGAAVGQGLLTVTDTTYGNINPGDRIDLDDDIFIVSQITNSPASKTFVSGGVPASSTSTLITLNNVTGLKVGNTLTGTGIPNGSFIIEIDAGTNTVRIEDAVTAQAAGTYLVTGGLGTYVVDTSATLSGTAYLYDLPEADNYKILKKIVPEGNNPTFTNGTIITDVITTVPANSATYRRWFVKARMGVKKRFGAFSNPGETDYETGRFPYNPNPAGGGSGGGGGLPGVFSSVQINNTTPFLTFSNQPSGVNPLYGIRGKSSDNDPWFVGGGATGIDAGYLEIATGDNAGDPADQASPIYVRQYNGYNSGGAPWYGGGGTIVNSLTLLDEDGNTFIPGTTTLNNGNVLTNSGNVFLFNTVATTVDAFGAATTVNIGVNGAGVVNIRPTTQSTSPSTGALQVAGGVGVVKDIFVGGAGYITGTGFIGGNTTLNNGTVLTNSGNVFLFNTVATTVDAFEAATTINIGAATGTTTIQHNLKVASVISTDDTRNATNTTDGSIQTDGGVSVVKDIFVGGDIIVSGSEIKSSLATTAITLQSDNVAIAGDLTVTGNDIKSSSATALTLSGANVTVAGDLTVTGNDIKSSSGTALTLSGYDTTANGDLTVGGNLILSTAGISSPNSGNAVITFISGNTEINGVLILEANEIAGAAQGGNPIVTAITITGPDVEIADDLNVVGDTTTDSIKLNTLNERKATTLTTTSTAIVDLVNTTRPLIKATISVNSGTNVQAMEVLVRRDAATALMTVYGEVLDSTSLFTISADMDGASNRMRLRATPASATSTTFIVLVDTLGTALT